MKNIMVKERDRERVSARQGDKQRERKRSHFVRILELKWSG